MDDLMFGAGIADEFTSGENRSCCASVESTDPPRNWTRANHHDEAVTQSPTIGSNTQETVAHDRDCGASWSLARPRSPTLNDLVRCDGQVRDFPASARAGPPICVPGPSPTKCGGSTGRGCCPTSSSSVTLRPAGTGSGKNNPRRNANGWQGHAALLPNDSMISPTYLHRAKHGPDGRDQSRPRTRTRTP
ncbi:hypothetical protein N7492_001330 [Penicillium capsulatum]|uniref:Uncharacterized protein n=1 Tax=Penicillium capsulatum TaxID=69766 RepID=A0A9W9M080_9EURO|nr:hypothetical protein N7492_001330 [Penicillium capsulatum]KAJ6129611.1 hypothetical protein N7512_002391 [Penicillium capsulatum]